MLLEPFDLGLLAVKRILKAADLFGAAGILATAIEGGKLRFQPQADRVAR